MLKNSVKRIAAGMAAAAITFVGATAFAATPANAYDPEDWMTDTLNPTNQIGTLGFYTTDGTALRESGTSLRNIQDPQSIKAFDAQGNPAGCPTGYNASSRTFVIYDNAPDGNRAIGFAAQIRLDQENADYGLLGTPIFLSGLFAATWSNMDDLDMFVTGDATYVVTCDPGAKWDGVLIGADRSMGESKYYAGRVHIDREANNGAGAWNVITAANPEDPDKIDTADINVSVPKAEVPVGPAEGLKITARPGDVTLNGATDRSTEADWTATGSLDDVTVTDDRRDSAGDAWTLNGKASVFRSGDQTISSAQLGWKPEKVTGAGNAGVEVHGAPADDGLSTDKALANGSASSAVNVKTTVNADLKLLVPAGSVPEGGNFASTLTLTLI